MDEREVKRIDPAAYQFQAVFMLTDKQMRKFKNYALWDWKCGRHLRKKNLLKAMIKARRLMEWEL